MPTFQDLERAFVKAHEAGDKQAAAALAAEMRLQMSSAEVKKPEEKKPVQATEPSEASSDLIRGFTNYLPQLQETYGGAKVLAGKVFGSEDLMKSGLATMAAAKAELASKHKATDSFTSALDKGVGAVLTDWLPYQIGSGAANLVESLGVMMAGAAAGSLIAPGLGTVGVGATALVEKELAKRGIKELAEKIAKESGEEAAKELFERETKAVVKDIAKKYAAGTALAAQAGFHGAGETTSRAVEEAQRLGKEATDIELERVLPSAIVHGVAEFFGDKIGLGAWKNINEDAKTGMLNLAGSLLKNMAVTGTKEAPVEVIQSAAERFGASLSLTDATAVKEYIDSAAAAYGMSVAPAAGGTVRSYANAMQKKDAELAQAAMESSQKASDEAAKISQTAVVDPQGNVAPVSFTPIQPGSVGASTAAAPAATTTAAPAATPTVTNDIIEATYAAKDVSTEKVRKELEPQLVAMGLDTKEKQKAFLVAKRDELGIPAYNPNAKGVEAVKSKNAKTQWVLNYQTRQMLKEGETSGGQLNEADLARNQSGTIDPSSATGVPAGGTTTPIGPRLDDTGGDVKPATVTTQIQPTPLEGKPSVTETTEAKQTKKEGQEKESAPKLTDEQLAKLYEEDVATAKDMGYNIPTWADLSAKEKEDALPALTDRAKTSGMLAAKGAKRIPLHVYKLIKKQLDAQVASGEVNAKVPQPIIDLYEEDREVWEKDNEVRTTTWSDLSTDEKAIYLSNIKRNTIEERNNALDILADYRDAKLEGVAPRGASFYEVNRTAYNKELPEWEELRPSEREAFLKAIAPGLGANTAKPKVTAEQMDVGFKAVVEKYNERAERRATRQTEINKGRDEQADKERARIQKEEESGEVEVGEKLDTRVKDKKEAATFEPFSHPALPQDPAAVRRLIKNMVNEGSAINTKLVEQLLGENTNAGVLEALARGDINGVLAALEKAKGMRLTEFGGYRFEGLELFENRYKAISQALFRHLAKTLNKLTYSSNIVLEAREANNSVIAQLKREGKLAAYDPKTDTFYFTNAGLDEQTVLHEIVHAATVKILYAYKTNPNTLTQDEREAAEHIDRIYEFAKKRLGDKPRYANAFENVFEFVSYALTDPTFQGELATLQAPSLNKYTKPTPGLNLNNVWSQFTKALMALYNLFKPKATRLQLRDELYPAASKEFYAVPLKSDKIKLQAPKLTAGFRKTQSNKKDKSSHPWDKWFPENEIVEVAPLQLMSKQAGYENNVLLEFTEAFKNIMAEPEAGIDIEALPAKAPIQAPAEGSPDFEAMRNAMPQYNSNPAKDLTKMSKSKLGEAAVRIFQNDRAAIKNWESKLRFAGRLVTYAAGFNNIYTQLTLSSGNAHYLYAQYVQNHSETIRTEVANYAKKRNLNINDAVNELGLFAIAAHEEERRRTLYIREVPLEQNLATLKDAKGNSITPFEARRTILKYLDKHYLDETGAKYLRDQLEKIVNDKNNLSKEESDKINLDINSNAYNVAGFSPEQIKAAKAEYNKNKNDADVILKEIKELNKAVIELNEKANYLSKYAKNYFMFYGYENYVPFKGKHFNDDKADIFNVDSRKLGGELQDQIHTFEGRLTVPDNPILQVMADGAQAAMRAGRKDVTQAIYNAVKDKTLQGSIMKFKDAEGKERDYISFEDRADDNVLAQLKGETKVFHYMPDGKVAVIQIDDKEQREAIRRSYRETNPLLDVVVNMGNLATGLIGQGHTRYNIAFAPVNFVRDVLTNAFTIGAELGPKESFRYIGAVATGVAQGGMLKTTNFARLYSQGKTSTIEALANSDKTGYYRDLLDYVKTGGKVSYIAGIAPKGQYQEFFKGVGGNIILNKKEQVDKYFDMWIDTFELSARVASYRVTKANEIARLTKEDPTKSKKEIEEAATVTASAYAKNLANFEQVGQLGKALGAFFMFFRPSATGAVRAIDAIAPMLNVNVERVVVGIPEYARAANIRQELSKGVDAAKEKELKAELAKMDKAIETFRENYSKAKTSASIMSIALVSMGIAAYLMSLMMSDDDDLGRNKTATDDMSRWTRFARFPIPGTDKIVQIPWGFGLGGMAALGAQMASMFNGNTRTGDIVANMAIIGMDSFLPLPVSRISPIEKPLPFIVDSMMPSVMRPIVEFTMNVDALGRKIYNDRTSRLGDAYTGGDNIPELYKDAAIWWLKFSGQDVSPNTLYFFANNYADGATRLVQNANNVRLWMDDKKDFNPKTDLMIMDSFFGTAANFDAREWSRVETDLEERSKYVKMLKANHPVEYSEYMAKNPLDQMLTKMYDHDVNGRLKDLREQANKWRAMEGLDPRSRTMLVKNIILQQNIEKRRLIDLYKAYGVKP